MPFAHTVLWIFVPPWSTLAIHRALNVGTQSILLQRVMGHCACSHVALCLSSRVAVAEGDSVFCPRCQGGRRDHVDVGWFQRMCHINGVEWPAPPQVTCVLCMDSMGEDRVAVPCCNQEVHVGCLAQSFNACGARCPFCVQPLREFAESPVFQAAALFHGHSVDVTGQHTKQEPIPWSFRVVSRAHRRICRCCVAAVWVLHHSSNQASTDAWSGLQCGNSRPWLGICSGSVSHVLVPFRQVTSRVAHRCRVECAVIHPTWWSIFNRMRNGIGAQDVKHAFLRKFVGRGSRMVLLPVWVHFTGGVSIPSQFQDRDHNRGCFAR